MTNWDIEEHESAHEYLEKPDVKVNDTIVVNSNNQLGYKKYKVILDSDGNKSLQTLADWGADIYEDDNNDEIGDSTLKRSYESNDEEEEDNNKHQRLSGGRRKSKRKKTRKSKRRKTRKSKRKTKRSKRRRKSRKH